MPTKKRKAGPAVTDIAEVRSELLASLTERESKALVALEQVAERFSLERLSKLKPFERAFFTSQGILALRECLTPFGPMLMNLKGSRLGFRTDEATRKGGEYSVDQVLDCTLEAVMLGARPAGNEFNIIAAGPYLTKEFFARALREFPGLSDLEIVLDVPKQSAGGAIVEAKADFHLAGSPVHLERTIPIRVNAGQGADAILGKARRKFAAQIIEILTGSVRSLPEGEVGEDPPGVIDVTPSGGAAKPEPTTEERAKASMASQAPLPDVGS